MHKLAVVRGTLCCKPIMHCQVTLDKNLNDTNLRFGRDSDAKGMISKNSSKLRDVISYLYI